jgi:hypothetical protein
MIDIEEISFNYTSAGVRSFSYSPQTISIKIPTTDITLKEYYRAFKSFLRAIGFSDEMILEFSLKSAIEDDENELVMVETIMEKFGIMDVEDHITQLNSYKKEILDLKAKISRLENPDNPQYTEEEIEIMTYENL